MSTKLEAAIAQGRRARSEDKKARQADAKARASERKKRVAEERERVRADHYKLFTSVRKAVRAGCSSFTLDGGENGCGWSPEEASVVADAIEAEHPEFSTRITTAKERDFCESLYDRGSIEVSWK